MIKASELAESIRGPGIIEPSHFVDVPNRWDKW